MCFCAGIQHGREAISWVADKARNLTIGGLAAWPSHSNRHCWIEGKAVKKCCFVLTTLVKASSLNLKIKYSSTINSGKAFVNLSLLSQTFKCLCRGNLCGQKQGSKTKKWISFEIKGNNMTLLEREDHLKQDAYSRLSKKITFQIKTYIQIIVHCDWF